MNDIRDLFPGRMRERTFQQVFRISQLFFRKGSRRYRRPVLAGRMGAQ